MAGILLGRLDNALLSPCSILQEDGTAGNDSEEEGSAEAKSESLVSDLDSDEDNSDDDEEAASRRLNVRTGALLEGVLIGMACTI